MSNSFENLNLIKGTREDDVFDINAPVVPDSLVKLGRGDDHINGGDGVDNLGQVLNIAQDVIIKDNRIEVVVDNNNTLIVHGLGSNDVPDLAGYFIF